MSEDPVKYESEDDQYRTWLDRSISEHGSLKGFALYFSRSQIPFPRDGKSQVPTYRHLGFYAYRKSFLETFTQLGESLLENTEKLEQLRVLEYGYDIKVVITRHDSPSVDVPGDIHRVEANFFDPYR